ncbi:MAG: hypothetical protein KDD62_14015, partial [Bdellovibrionales bacterium]|nr:hypothetical protein [Bdellovibrionales bacterium]
HRTGRSTRPILERVLKGFNVEEIAHAIWQDAMAHDAQTETRALAYMKDLTNQQVRELREYYNTIPARLLANLLRHALHRTNIEGKSYPNIFMIRYLLQGRTRHEVEQIEFQFNEQFHFVRFGDGEPTLREQVDCYIAPEYLEEIHALLGGFEVDYFVKRITQMLAQCVEVGEPESSQSLHHDFSGNFRRSYQQVSFFEQELRARDAINDLLGFCTPQQFQSINQALLDKTGKSLDERLYQCNQPRSIREIARVLFKGLTAVKPRRQCVRDEDYLSDELLQEVKDDFRLSTNKEIKDVIRIHAEEVRAREGEFKLKQGLSALLNLDPHEIFEVEAVFLSLYKVPLGDFIIEQVERVSLGEVQKYSSDLIALVSKGIGRLGLKADLFNLFQSRERRLSGKIEAQEKQRVREEAIDTVEKVNRILKRNQSARERAAAIISLLGALDSYSLLILEQVYLELSPEQQTLQAAVEECLPLTEQRLIEGLLDGVNILELAQSISNDP